MDFLINLLTGESVAHSVLILSLVVALGLALGSLRVFGVSLGVAGVLFAGIFFGHFQMTIDPHVMEFIREFGLILFVYTIGLQVGPGIVDSLRRDGLFLNMMAVVIVLGGVLLTVGLSHIGHVPWPVAIGMFSGATTNTPSLAAAQQAFKEIPAIAEEAGKMSGLGYAIAYPFGVIGIILTMILVRFIFRINPSREAEIHKDFHHQNAPVLNSVDLRIENKNLNGLPVKKIPAIEESGVVVSRVSHAGKIQVALPNTRVYVGDIIHLVGPKEKLDELEMIIGSRSDVDLRVIKSDVTAQRVIVTRHAIVGKTVEEINATGRYGVTLTRLSRSEVEFAVTPDTKIHFADTLVVVGEEDSIKKFAGDMGNSPKDLDHPQLIPVFVGIALGVILGSWPIYFPAMPAPVKLGLAGGPLIVAIVLSRIGHIGRLVWYMPTSANFMLRHLGIALFLACVGLRSGGPFLKTLLEGQGFLWMGYAALITLIPILLVGLFARLRYQLNYMTICGLLAGSMTDPPALAFANSLATSSAPSIAYTTVYPLVMILRIVSVQVLVFCFH